MTITNTTLLNDTSPIGSDAANQLDTFITSYKAAVTDRAAEEHNWGVSQAVDGSHSEGSARVGVITGGATLGTHYPVDNATTSRVGKCDNASTNLGGNEIGRIIRLAGAANPELGRVLVSSNDAGTVVWNDLVKRVKAAAGATAFIVDTGNIDMVSSAGITKAGANEMDPHAHASRHLNTAAGTDGTDFDYIAGAVKAVTLPAITAISRQCSPTIRSTFSFPYTNAYRGVARILIHAVCATDVSAGTSDNVACWITETLDGTYASGLTNSHRVANIVAGGGGFAANGVTRLNNLETWVWVPAVSVAAHTYYFNTVANAATFAGGGDFLEPTLSQVTIYDFGPAT